MTALGAKMHDEAGRSIGRRKTNRRTQIGGQFAPRLIDMLRSPAYRILSLSERRCLDRLEIELADHGGADNGKLPCRYDDFEAYGVHRHSIAPSLRALAALGFIEVTEEGRAGNAEWRRPTLFRLTYRPNATMGATDEWRRIETRKQAEAIARAARRVSKKQKSSVGKRPSTRCGNRTTNGQIHSAKTATTGLGAETTTTLDISEGGRPIKDRRRMSRRFAVIQGGVPIRMGVRVTMSEVGQEPSKCAEVSAADRPAPQSRRNQNGRTP